MPVISYDRLITNAAVNYYISFDNVRVGKLQGDSAGQEAEEGRQARAPIVMINGAPTDNNAKLFKQGAHSVLDGSGIKMPRNTTRPTGARQGPERDAAGDHGASARTGSTASTPPTTEPPAARSPP